MSHSLNGQMSGCEFLVIARVESQGSLELLAAKDVSNGSVDCSSRLITENGFKKKVESILEESINQLGVESAKAQNLKAPITSFQRLLNGTYPNSPTKYLDSIYLLLSCDRNSDVTLIGFIKAGTRSLYLQRNGQLCNVPNCFSILDFYIREQRKGFGLLLFSQMLHFENVKAKNCAIDRPTPAMLSFFKKHFSLETPLKQHNHYVIFDCFFT